MDGLSRIFATVAVQFLLERVTSRGSLCLNVCLVWCSCRLCLFACWRPTPLRKVALAAAIQVSRCRLLPIPLPCAFPTLHRQWPSVRVVLRATVAGRLFRLLRQSSIRVTPQRSTFTLQVTRLGELAAVRARMRDNGGIVFAGGNYRCEVEIPLIERTAISSWDRSTSLSNEGTLTCERVSTVESVRCP